LSVAIHGTGYLLPAGMTVSVTLAAIPTAVIPDWTPESSGHG
jgi:hypothetical protein